MSEFSTSGHVGAFYFGGEYDNAITSGTTSFIDIAPNLTSGTSATVSTTPAIDETYISIVVPDTASADGSENLKISFIAKKVSDESYHDDCYVASATQITGGNPLNVEFKACVTTQGIMSDYEPVEYKWWFDYENYATSADYVSTTVPYVEHTYCGSYLQDYDVRLCVTLNGVISGGTSATTEEMCYDRESYIKTYGIDELKYGQDRHINLVDYLPEYVRNSDTADILQEFENYLNTMYDGQTNYTWSENDLEITIHDTHDTKQWTSCNDIDGCSGTCSGDCTNLASSVVTNDYTFTGVTSAGPVIYNTVTPADSAGELFIDNMCGIKEDKISILDKIFRLTELFDPDLMPDDMIQYYAENLGYQAGINRESIGAIRTDKEAEALEQKRYLRFMMRNLPNWYQIKSTRSSIKIMMYSFGLIGDFVYYYTKCYSDTKDVESKGLCGFDNRLSTNDSISGTPLTSGGCNLYQIDNCEDYLTKDPRVTTEKEMAKYRSCLSKYKRQVEDWDTITKSGNGVAGNDWLLTTVNTSSIEEDLTPIPEDVGYFSSPHFRLWVELDGSSGNYSMDEERQRMIGLAINAIKPINTVFDGVASHWETLVMMYMKPYQRIRKHIQIVSDGTYTSATYL